MTQTTAAKPTRRTARKPEATGQNLAAKRPPAKVKAPRKLDQLEAMLQRESGASVAEMTEATGWQQHSVRGAMAGALKKRGLTITSEKVDGTRRYRAERPA